MCQIGDIIVVYRYKDGNKTLPTHSFVVLDDNNGQIQGIDFDFVGLVMSSFKDEEQKKRKLSYPGNFPITPDDQEIYDGNNGESGYIKAEQFYYFNKEKIPYKVIGKLDMEIFNLLIEFIQKLVDDGVEFKQITENL